MSELNGISGAEMAECLGGIGKALYDLDRLAQSPIPPIAPNVALRQLMDAVDALRAADRERERARAVVIDAAIAFVAMSRGQFTTPQPREND